MSKEKNERQARIANILGVRGGASAGGGGIVRTQATASEAVEEAVAGKMDELLDELLPHIKQIQERQSIEEHSMTLLEEMIQSLR